MHGADYCLIGMALTTGGLWLQGRIAARLHGVFARRGRRVRPAGYLRTTTH